MADSDKNILITPNRGQVAQPSVVFTGQGNDPIVARVLDGVPGALSFEGSAGQLFSITNNLTSGSIFSVNDVSGIPSIDVNADGTVSIAGFGGNVGVGLANPSQKLDVAGNIRLGSQVSGAVVTPPYLSLGTSYSNTYVRANCKIRLIDNGADVYGFGIGPVGDIQYHSVLSHVFYLNNVETFGLNSTNIAYKGNTIWHSGNDGAGSGLDADLLDGLNAASANTASTIVARDASGNFSAGTITAALSGNASTASAAAGNSFFTQATAGEGQIGAAFSGQNSVYLFNNSAFWGIYSASGGVAFQYTRSSGLFNFNGNANTATTLATTRTIWGQNFNGSANVTGALSGATTIDATSDITLGGELNFGGAANKYIDFYTDNDAGALSTAHLRLVNNANTSFHSAIHMTRGGAVTLYHNNSAKLATSSTGVSITGTLTVSSNTLVTNLNADLLDGKNTGTSGNTIPLLDGANTWSAQQTYTARILMNSTAAERQIAFNNGTTDVYFYGTTSAGDGIGMYDGTNVRGVWQYSPSGNRLDIYRNTRFHGLVGLDAGQSLFFGREESFGGTDIGGADYGYIVWDNDNNTYNTGGAGDSGENGCLRIGTQNDGFTTANDNLALEPTNDLWLYPIGGRVHFHKKNSTGGGQNTFTGLNNPSDASGRAQLILSSSYSDLVIASSQVNNDHGSTLTFATYNPSVSTEYKKFVIGQGNWGTRAGYLDFGYSDTLGRANPHANINTTDCVMTLDGYNKRVGIGPSRRAPACTLDVAGEARFIADNAIVATGTNASDDVWGGCIEIREVNQVGNAQTGSPYAPGITFHWGAVSASAIKMYSDGSIRFISQGSTGSLYRPIYANQFISNVATGTAPLTVSSTTLVTNLNADLLDNEQLVDNAATASTVVGRDGSGDIHCRLIRQTFADQASIAGGIVYRVNNSTDNYLRVCSDTGAIRTFLNVPTRTGGDASGTWGISITGNAATATTLQTARLIGGVSFNGSADITPFRANTLATIDGGSITSSSTTYAARNAVSTPQQYGWGVNWEFKNASVVSGTGNYAGLLTLAPWAGTTASTGDPHYQLAFSPVAANSTNPPTMKIRAGIDTTWGSWSTFWHQGNDGSGSGLDADLLDGKNTGTSGNTIPLLDGTNTWSAAQTFTLNAGSYGANNAIRINTSFDPGISFTHTATNYSVNLFIPGGTWSKGLAIGGGSYGNNLYEIWHAGNDGAGSGLDADLLDGENLIDNAATANTVVGRDPSGDIFARLIRQTFPNQTTISGGLVFRINDSTDNYLRVCSDTAAIRTFLDTPSLSGDNTFTGGNKISIQNATDGGNSRGIFLWNDIDSNWGIYMSTAGAGKSLSGGTASNSLSGRAGHHFRNRIFGGAGNSFVWENNAETQLMEIQGDTGNVHVRGSIVIAYNNPSSNAGIVLADDGDIIDPNTGYCAMRFAQGVQIYSGNKSGSPAITLGSNGVISASRVACGYDSGEAGSVSCSNFFRSSGNSGWYNATYNGGWWMTTADYVSSYADKSVYTGGSFRAGTIDDNPATNNNLGARVGGQLISVNRDNVEFPPLFVGRRGAGDLVRWYRNGGFSGSISVNASDVVSYNPFLGSHWARLEDESKPEILPGTILETINKLMEWKLAIFEVDGEEKKYAYNGLLEVGSTIEIEYEGNTYEATIIYEDETPPDSNKHVCVKVNDTPASKAVFGVFLGWDEGRDENFINAWNDMFCAAVGNYFIRIAAGQSLEIGDLIEADGTGCGVVQPDDIIRSKTVGKVTSTIPQVTYEDGSFLVTAVLYCG